MRLRWILASCLLALAALASAPADAGMWRMPVVVQPTPTTRVPGNLPTTPEPASALAFGLGVGLVAWAGRKRHS